MFNCYCLSKKFSKSKGLSILSFGSFFRNISKYFVVWIILAKVFFSSFIQSFKSLKISKCPQLFLISWVTYNLFSITFRTLDELFSKYFITHYLVKSTKTMKTFSSYLSRLVEYFWDIIEQVLGEVFPSWIEVGYWYLPQYQLNNVTLSIVVFIKKGLDWFGFTIQSNL